MALSTCPRNEPRLVLTPPKQPMRQETRSNDTYDISHLDPVTLWLSSALITKLIFCNIEKWEDTVQKRNPDFTELTKANVKKGCLTGSNTSAVHRQRDIWLKIISYHALQIMLGVGLIADNH